MHLISLRPSWLIQQTDLAFAPTGTKAELITSDHDPIGTAPHCGLTQSKFMKFWWLHFLEASSKQCPARACLAHVPLPLLKTQQNNLPDTVKSGTGIQWDGNVTILTMQFNYIMIWKKEGVETSVSSVIKLLDSSVRRARWLTADRVHSRAIPPRWYYVNTVQNWTHPARIITIGIGIR